MAERMATGRPFRIVVVSHGRLAAALLASAKMICGRIPDAVAVCLKPEDSPETYRDRLMAAIGTDRKPVLILADIQGGTPYNVSSVLAGHAVTTGPELALVCGVNLGMLLEVVTSLESIDEDAIAGLVAASRASVVDASRRPVRSGA
jgi:PTS system mannose-specific IIA component